MFDHRLEEQQNKHREEMEKMTNRLEEQQNKHREEMEKMQGRLDKMEKDCGELKKENCNNEYKEITSRLDQMTADFHDARIRYCISTFVMEPRGMTFCIGRNHEETALKILADGMSRSRELGL